MDFFSILLCSLWFTYNNNIFWLLLLFFAQKAVIYSQKFIRKKLFLTLSLNSSDLCGCVP